ALRGGGVSEFRQDPTTGEWTIIAPARGLRPHEPKTGGGTPDAPPADYDPACPFCPGNEHMLPPLVEEKAHEGRPGGWYTRVVPNKFPILAQDEGWPDDPLAGGYGRHEVIIETPRHGADLPDLHPDEALAVIDTWQGRFRAALALPGIEAVILFRNRGKGAGASIAHAHSQLVALPMVPPRLAVAHAHALAHWEDHRGCATCDYLRRERETGERVVEHSGPFAVLVPFAQQAPFEQWIVPRDHRPLFGQEGAEERRALAGAIQRAIRRLKAVAGDVAYNLALEPGSPEARHEPATHWKMRVIPDLVTPGGFEMVSGLSVDPGSPEADVSRLREAPGAA
ncbi:MAG: hypothetical protein PHE36_14575, partial [Novosphingobium sp.]|nr:hypothetical protein [Novosphingobium sp.]